MNARVRTSMKIAQPKQDKVIVFCDQIEVFQSGVSLIFRYMCVSSTNLCLIFEFLVMICVMG